MLPNTRNLVKGAGHSDCCFEDRLAQDKADFREALKNSLAEQYWRLKELYGAIIAMYPREVKVQIPFHSIVDSMKRWRREKWPACPDSLEVMARQLQEPAYARLLEWDHSRLTTRTIRDPRGNLHLLIFDSAFVRISFQDVDRLFIDGTFQTKPRIAGVYQLVTLLAVRYDHAIPFAHVLMSKKLECSYRAVFHEIRTHVIDPASVRVVMTDFETGLRNACRDVFENAIIAGCTVHYDRALLKKVKTLRLSQVIQASPEAKLLLKKIMALACLPADMIRPEYDRLVDELEAPLRQELEPFLAYYERQWLRTVSPAGFSVFGISKRTNNVSESYNSVLATQLGHHPSAWTFITKLAKLTSDARDDVESLGRTEKISRHPRYATGHRKEKLEKAWQKLISGDISAAEFLTMGANLKRHLTQRIIRMEDNVLEVEQGEEEEFDGYRDDIPAVDDPDYDRDRFGRYHPRVQPVPEQLNEGVREHAPEPQPEQLNEGLPEPAHEPVARRGRRLPMQVQEIEPLHAPEPQHEQLDEGPPEPAHEPVARRGRRLRMQVHEIEPLHAPEPQHEQLDERPPEPAHEPVARRGRRARMQVHEIEPLHAPEPQHEQLDERPPEPAHEPVARRGRRLRMQVHEIEPLHAPEPQHEQLDERPPEPAHEPVARRGRRLRMQVHEIEPLHAPEPQHEEQLDERPPEPAHEPVARRGRRLRMQVQEIEPLHAQQRQHEQLDEGPPEPVHEPAARRGWSLRMQVQEIEPLHASESQPEQLGEGVREPVQKPVARGGRQPCTQVHEVEAQAQAPGHAAEPASNDDSDVDDPEPQQYYEVDCAIAEQVDTGEEAGDEIETETEVSDKGMPQPSETIDYETGEVEPNERRLGGVDRGMRPLNLDVASPTATVETTIDGMATTTQTSEQPEVAVSKWRTKNLRRKRRLRELKQQMAEKEERPPSPKRKKDEVEVEVALVGNLADVSHTAIPQDLEVPHGTYNDESAVTPAVSEQPVKVSKAQKKNLRRKRRLQELKLQITRVVQGPGPKRMEVSAVAASTVVAVVQATEQPAVQVSKARKKNLRRKLSLQKLKGRLAEQEVRPPSPK